MVSVSVIPILFNTLRTAIGSMEEMRAPNVKDSTNGMLGHAMPRKLKKLLPLLTTNAVRKVLMSVPITA